jgi:hypothetical protein
MSYIDNTSAGRSQRQWEAYVPAQIRQGRPAQELVTEAVSDGLSEQEARELVSRAIRSEKGKSRNLLGCSTLMLLGGVILTFTSINGNYLHFNGEEYIVIYFGSVVAGIVGIIYSIRQMKKIRGK